MQPVDGLAFSCCARHSLFKVSAAALLLGALVLFAAVRHFQKVRGSRASSRVGRQIYAARLAAKVARQMVTRTEKLCPRHLVCTQKSRW